MIGEGGREGGRLDLDLTHSTTKNISELLSNQFFNFLPSFVLVSFLIKMIL